MGDLLKVIRGISINSPTKSPTRIRSPIKQQSLNNITSKQIESPKRTIYDHQMMDISSAKNTIINEDFKANFF